MRTVLVTGGAGFIGSNFVRHILARGGVQVVNLDKLTYAGSLESLTDVINHPGHLFIRGDIRERGLITELLRTHRIGLVVNFAAETHVDRSIDDPEAFIQSNVVGVFELLEAVRGYWNWLKKEERETFRFVHISTDEVYGSLGSDGFFSEESRYAPNSPYSASKAASDHLVRAYNHTYGLPVLITNCSNNYGPYQFPEKLIPLMIVSGIKGSPLPVYGDGRNVRDWIYVLDHCSAIWRVLKGGRVGDSYNIGGSSEKTNLEVVYTLCDLLDKLRPRPDGCSYRRQIVFVEDRPGHDWRYAMDDSKIRRELGWEPVESFETGLYKTVTWYLNNPQWFQGMQQRLREVK